VFSHCHSPLIRLHQTHLCFPNLNLKFQVCQFDTMVAIPYNVMEKLQTITEDKFSKCFQSSHICCNKCSYSLVDFSQMIKKPIVLYSTFLLYFSLITLLSRCVNVYFLILVITEWVSINKKGIFSQQPSLKTKNYVLPDWNGYCRRRDWLLHY
jgi:hypothetical protein